MQYNFSKIKRKKFVEILFDIGIEYEHGYDTIVAAVQLGDQLSRDTLFCYSVELAHVLSVIVAKANEEHGYREIRFAIKDTNNESLSSMEWEILGYLGFQVKVKNFVTLFAELIRRMLPESREFFLGPSFLGLSLVICSDKKLLSACPVSQVFAAILLFRNGKLEIPEIGTNREEIIINEKPHKPREDVRIPMTF